MELSAIIILLILLHRDATLASKSLNSSDDVKIENVRFYLYTPGVKQAQQLWPNDSRSVSSSSYDFGRATKFMAHGVQSHHLAPVSTDIRDALLARSEDNVITVDWSDVANRTEPRSVVRALPAVARFQARMVDLLVQLGTDPKSIALVGHSAGAVIASLASRCAKSKVGHLVALDPPSTALVEHLINYRLPVGLTMDASMGDADLVEIVYTQYAVREHLGHAISYYPNGGLPVQPGCDGTNTVYKHPLVCSHMMAYEFFVEAVKRPELFVARKCRDYQSFIAGDCNNNTLVSFPNSLAEEKEEGKYYLITGSEPPYGLGLDGARSPSL